MVLFPIYHSFATTGAVHAMAKVSAPDAATIANGGAYVNVHSTKYPAGEIRGQLLNNTGVRYLAGELSGKNETPPNSSAARGTVIVSYNTDSNFLQLAGDYQKLSDSVTVAQLVTPGVGVDSVIAITTSRDSTGTMIVLRDTITDAQEAVLLAGTAYVNVHSKAFPNGEIKTLLMPTANGQTQVFAVNLSPQQEVPPITNSTATGNALIIVDKTTGQTYTTGAFSGINSTVFKADIDRGPAGDTGSVILPLNPSYITSTKSGTFSGSGIVPQSTIDSMSDGLAYVNIYSTKFPSGAIRGQLAGLILPLKLTYFNGYRQANNVELLWETSEEVNVSRYEVEQYNITNNSWTTKGTVLPQGGSGDTKYSFEDLPNLYGNQYVMYRLKMIDKDGRITYSSLIRLNYENLKAELFIQANPVVNGTLRYTITGLSTGKKAEISVIDYTGRLVLRNTISSLINNTLEIPRLSAGMYKLVVRFDDTVLQKSFIK